MPCPYPLPIYIDSSMRGTFKSCKRKFRNTYLRRLVSPKPSIHLHAGKAFAHACEVTRIARYKHNLEWPAAVDEGQVALYQKWFECGEDVDLAGTAKTLDNMLLLHEKYFDEYDRAGSDLVPLIRDCGKPAVEFSFACPIPGTVHPETGEEILYVGKLDMLALRQGVESTVWPVDEKTCSQLGDKWGQQWELRGQFIGYCWAARTYGYDCPGAIVRGCKITGNGNIGYGEATLQIHPHIIDRWLETLRRDVEEIIACWKEDRFDFDFADACSAYGGCAYQISCSAKDPDRWLESNFVPNTWNPITGDGPIEEVLPHIEKPKKESH